MKRSVILILSLLVLLTLPTVIYAETEVGGIISSDSTWTVENSPYLVTESVQVPEGVNLTINPGVTVSVSDKLPWDEAMFKVGGEVNAHGKADEKITFEASNSSYNFSKDGVFLRMSLVPTHPQLFL